MKQSVHLQRLVDDMTGRLTDNMVIVYDDGSVSLNCEDDYYNSHMTVQEAMLLATAIWEAAAKACAK